MDCTYRIELELIVILALYHFSIYISIFNKKTYCCRNSKRGGMATHAGVALELGIHRPAAGGKASKVIADITLLCLFCWHRWSLIQTIPTNVEQRELEQCLILPSWYIYSWTYDLLDEELFHLTHFKCQVCMSPQMEAILIWCQCRTRDYEVSWSNTWNSIALKKR